MKFNSIIEKGKVIVSKIGKKTIVVSCSVVVIGIAVLLNFLLIGDTNKEGLKPAVDLSDLSSINTEETGQVIDEDSNYFATMALSRRQARDEAMEVLQGVVDNENAVEDAKAVAMEDIRKIADTIEVEANIESLILSKGFEQCIAVINNDSASVIVKSEGLLPNQVSQISEIVYEQAGILPTNLNIIEKN